jgi:hypothetical protein
MNKLLKEFIKEIILQEFRSSFKINDFKKIQNARDRNFYASQHLPFLGKGSSRVVYALPNTKYVLKLARNMAGKSQNEAEVELITKPGIKKLAADIYDFDKDYYWLISETVREFKNEREAISRINLPNQIIGKNGEKLTVAFEIWIELAFAIANDNNEIEILRTFKNDFPDELSKFLINPWAKDVINFFKETNQPFGDLTAVSHWGITGNGRIVILDYGYTEETIKKHYGRGSEYNAKQSFTDF